MSWHNSELPLHQMLDHAREVIILSKGKSPKELVDDRVLGLAIVRLMEIIGEAANDPNILRSHGYKTSA